jgi:NAD(P)H dehydrogenase (quinone)
VLLQGGHAEVVYDVTGSEKYSADTLAALYGELGGRHVGARAIDDKAFIAGLVGDSTADDHLRYGAELLASFGRAIREGYLDACSDAVLTLTGRRARTLGEVLAPHLRAPME